MGRARARGTAAARREANKAATTAMTAGIKQMTNFWAETLTPITKTRRRRTRR